MIGLITLLKILVLFKKQKKIIAEFKGIKIECNTIDECEEQIKKLKIKERLQQLKNLTAEEEKKRNEALKLLRLLEQLDIEKKGQEQKEKNKKNDFDIGF